MEILLSKQQLSKAVGYYVAVHFPEQIGNDADVKLVIPDDGDINDIIVKVKIYPRSQ